ncbi:MAG TPA: prolyl aminopeptidase [Gammaproteobacteria bacterium]|nr:prolyl aminopeptidase [Gammaproteobacteria bacterium]
MRDFYPAIEPYNTCRIQVSDIHNLYVEECGSADGIPIVFLHGGPGGGIEAKNRRFFDPERFRIVLFDQRGAGRSTPHAELTDNDTQALVGDIETVRETLGIDRWAVFGGSWGSTLALAYAEAHPDRVVDLILRGIFLCRRSDLEWFYQEGASHIFPDHFEDFLAPIPEAERGDMMQAYYRRLTDDDPEVRHRAAEAWSLWEGRCSTLLPNDDVVSFFSNPDVALAIARIECHYFVNDIFMRPNQLIEEAGRLADIPGTIVQGRYDVVCPADGAWALHRAWPKARFEFVADAGHASTEPGIRTALLNATDALADRLA